MDQNGIQFTVQIKNDPTEPKKEKYFWELIVPPRSQFGDYNSPTSTFIVISDIKFKSGLLAGVRHTGRVELASNRIEAVLELPKDNSIVKWSAKSGHIVFYAQEELLNSLELDAFELEYYGPSVYWTVEHVFAENDEFWSDIVTKIRIYFLIEKATPEPVNVIQSSLNDEKNAFVVDNKPEWNGSPNFFLSNELSDVKFTCEGIEFPSHKFLLSSRSPVLNRMLHSISDMSEAKEGNIEITDMKSNILKEMLRFMYCGTVENLEEISQALIVAADNYDLTNLKALCENSLIGQLNAENALAFYSLGKSVDAKSLIKLSLDLIELNKSAVFKNSEEFMQFTIRYPEVAFQLLKM